MNKITTTTTTRKHKANIKEIPKPKISQKQKVTTQYP